MNDVMVAGTISEIPISLIVFIAVYLCGLWIMAFMLGFNRWPYEPFVVVFSSVLWPLLLIFLALVSCGDKLEEITSRDDADKVKRRVRGVIRLIGIATLPFRPFAFGRAVSNWRKSRKVN